MTVSRNDPEAVLGHDRHLRRLARSLLFDAHRAEDAAQDAWLAALETGAEPRSPGGWLRATLRNLAYSGLRREGQRPARERRAARREGVPSAEEILEREAERTRVVRAVLGLSEPYRSVVLLRYFENLPPREIARRTGVPVETVRTRLRRALEQLRVRLGPGRRDGASGRTLLLIAGLRPGSVQAFACATATKLTTGALLMSAKLKFALAGLALLIAALAFLQFGGFEPPRDESSGAQAPDAPRVLSGEAAEAAGNPDSRPGQTVSSVPFQEPREEAADVAPYGALEVQVVYDEDGSPAPRTMLRILPWGGADPFYHGRWVRADEHGRVTFERVHAGRVGMYPHPGGRAVATVEPGKTTQAEVRIPKGYTVQGIVVDENDQPVKGAEIVLSRDGNFIQGEVAGTSGADGRFKLRSVGTFRSVGARSERHGPSAMQFVLAKPGETVNLRLVMKGEAGTVRGLVTDTEGRPVRGALVQVGHAKHDQFTLPGGGQAANPGPQEDRTDAEGRFEFHGLRPGEVPVSVRGADFAVWTGTVEVVGSSVRNVSVELQPGAAIVGTITGADGKPAARVEVVVGRYGDFRSPWTRTGADGRYRLVGVTAGEVEVHADADDRGKTSGKVVAIAGGEVTWDAQLAQGRMITGIVLDEARKPLAGWSVKAEAAQSGQFESKFAKTGKDGGFELKNCSMGAYRLEVHEPDRWGMSAATRLGVKPGGEALEIVIPDEARASVMVKGKVTDLDGRTLTGVQVTVFREEGGGSPIELADPQTGRFELGPYPAGRYTVGLHAKGLPRWRSEKHALASGETWDLGTVALQPGGNLVVNLSRKDGSPVGKPWLSLRPVEGRGFAPVSLDGDVARSGPAAAGRQRLSISGQDVVTDERIVTIEAGRTTTIDVVLVSGVRRALRFEPAAGGASIAELTWTVRDTAGQVVCERKARGYRDQPVRASVGLPPGRYTVEAVAPDGRRGRGPLEIADLKPSKETVVVTLQ